MLFINFIFWMYVIKIAVRGFTIFTTKKYPRVVEHTQNTDWMLFFLTFLFLIVTGLVKYRIIAFV